MALPKNYKEPDTSNYMRMKQGENKLRILSDIIVGMEYWKDDGDRRTPIRKRADEKIDINDLELDKEGQKVMPKHFWAMVVWNYESEKVQILEITQSTIRRKLVTLERNKDWGDLKDYDITITRDGVGFDTEYDTTQSPKKPIDKGIVQFYKDMNINLEALYEGDDPFNAGNINPDEVKV